MTEGWFRTTICAVKDFATVGGLSVGFGGTWSSLKAATRVGPLYQPIFVDGFAMLSPLYALMGMKGILSTLYPTDFRRVETSDLMWVNRASLDRKSVV